ncbi:MAG: hypothetical protein IK070_00535, partial [Clostridia bacterium]|nr:hypothetical protein [Clostridia bacterium]
MTSIDNHTTTAKQINLFGTGDEFIKFVSQVGDKVYDLQNLMFFKFEQQTTTSQEYTSERSGARISLLGTHAVLTLCDISSNINENIIAFTNFGYENDEFYQYNLIPDYKLTVNNSGPYYTPNLIDMFTGTTTACGAVVFTNADYDYSNQIVESGNKLYLPTGFAENITELKTKLPTAFVDSFNYEDEEGQGEYYHIYFTITVASDGNNMNNYDRLGYLINLKYKSTSQKIDIRFMTTFGYLLSTKITVNPGVTYNGNTSRNIPSSNLLAGENISSILSAFEPNPQANYFSVEISNVDFAVTATTSDNLAFYYVSADSKYVETYVEVLQEDISYKTENEYNALAPEQQTGYNQYYIKTNDIGIVAGKNYYLKNNVFTLVETPNIDEIEEYYEKVYVVSTKAYYGRETYYEKITSGLSPEYIAKYYVAIFKKAPETFDSMQTYYILNNNEYQVVDSPNEEDISLYYVKDYMPATSYDSNAEYYYKKNYKLLESGADITEVFELTTISIAKSNANYVLIATAEDTAKLQNISDSIDLSFV